MNLRKATLIVTTVLAATLAANAVAIARPVPLQTTDGVRVIQMENQCWYFSGTARIISDITKKETWWSVFGYVNADSRAEALRMAKESGRAQAAIAGRVLSVNIQTLH